MRKCKKGGRGKRHVSAYLAREQDYSKLFVVLVSIGTNQTTTVSNSDVQTWTGELLQDVRHALFPLFVHPIRICREMEPGCDFHSAY